MDTPPKKTRSSKQQMQLDRARWLDALQRAVVDGQIGLTPVTFFVVWTLVTRFHNDRDGAFPSHQTLANATALGVKTVQVHLDLAVEAGFLIKKRVGGMQPNVYFINLEVLQRSDDRIARPDQSTEVIGLSSPIRAPSILTAEGVLGEQPGQAEGVDDSHAAQVIGLTTPSDRACQSKVIGPVGPTNHVVDNHEEEPRRATRDARPGARTRPGSSDSDSSLSQDNRRGRELSMTGFTPAPARDAVVGDEDPPFI